LIREVDNIEEILHQLKLRKAGEVTKMPRTSHLMDQVIELNRLNLLHDTDRKRLHDFLTGVRQTAPVLHMSFTADPQVAFIEKLMAWLRHEIHPLVLVTFGLQPNLGAGCVIRTVNKRFDLSLRQDLVKNRDILVSRFSSLGQPVDAPSTTSSPGGTNVDQQDDATLPLSSKNSTVTYAEPTKGGVAA
jgi:hypothetical protein